MLWFGGKKKREISWWEPRWAYVPRMWREFRIVFRPEFMIRATSIALLVFAAMVLAAKALFPFLQLGFLWMAPGCVAAVFAFIFFKLGAHVAIPPNVCVRPERVRWFDGQAGWRIDSQSIHAVRLVVFSASRIRLRIWYTHKSQRRTKTIGVSPNVDLDALTEVLPVKPKVIDARNRALRLLH